MILQTFKRNLTFCYFKSPLALSCNMAGLFFMVALISFLCLSCKPKKIPVFSKINSSYSGLKFTNQVFDTDTVNLAHNYYFYNGGGVAISDFTVIPTSETGLFLNGDQKSIASLFLGNKQVVITGANSGKLKGHQFHRKYGGTPEIVLLDAFDTRVEITFIDGRKTVREYFYGNTYLSQSTRKIQLTDNMKEMLIHNSKGESRKVR